jgi:transposase
VRRAAGGKNRSPDEPADHALGRSRGGFGTKLHLVTDGNGVPLQVLASAGQRHECLFAEPVLRATQVRCANRRWRSRPRQVAGDKGYSYPAVRRYLRRRRIQPVIPTRKNQPADPKFDRQTYRRRNVVERCVGWLKENRRLGTRHEKLAVSFTAMAKWAIARRYFRILDSSDRT